MEAHAVGHAHEHGEHPPTAHVSSRVDARVLGMLLFIGSEIMLFGSFFTAYFFVRVVNGYPWPPEGDHLPVFIAGVNTVILVTSSFTMHWALQSIKRGHRAGLQAGLVLTFLMGLAFLLTQIAEYARVGFAPGDNAFATIFYCLTGLHGAHVFVGLSLLLFATIRAFRGHYSPEHHHGVELPGNLLALRRRNVDRGLHDGLHPLGRGAPEPVSLRGRGVPARAAHDRRLRRDRCRGAARRLGPSGSASVAIAVVAGSGGTSGRSRSRRSRRRRRT